MAEKVEEYYGATEYWKPRSKPLSIRVVEREPNYLKLEADGETHTLFNMLVSELRKNDDVVFVAYKIEHPLKEKVIFSLQTRKSDPLELVKASLKVIREKLRDFKKSLEKSIDQPPKNPYFIQEEEWEEFLKENF